MFISGQNEVLLVLLSFFSMLGNNACFKSSNCRWASCSLTDSQIHGLIKTGRFFENLTSWAPCSVDLESTTWPFESILSVSFF